MGLTLELTEAKVATPNGQESASTCNVWPRRSHISHSVMHPIVQEETATTVEELSRQIGRQTAQLEQIRRMTMLRIAPEALGIPRVEECLTAILEGLRAAAPPP